MTTRRLIIALTICLSAAAAVYSQGTGKQARRHIKLPTTSPQAAFSDGVLRNDVLYLAGRLGIDPKTGKVPDDPKEEVRIILDGLKATLAAASMTMDDLLTVQVFCTDPEKHYETFNEIYRSYFKGPLPARAFLGSGTLLRGARFEVLGTAAKN